MNWVEHITSLQISVGSILFGFGINQTLEIYSFSGYKEIAVCFVLNS